MRFGKREVRAILIQKDGKDIYNHQVREFTETPVKMFVFAHTDNDNGSQLLGIEIVNLTTGEIITQRINLPTSEMYFISIREVLDVDKTKIHEMLD